MSTVRFIITAHPIDVKFQKSLKIYNTSIVETKRVGTVIKRLVQRGHINVHTHLWNDEIRIHCSMGKKEEE